MRVRAAWSVANQLVQVEVAMAGSMEQSFGWKD